MSKEKFSKLSKAEKLDLFKIEELEPRLETAWKNEGCNNDSCEIELEQDSGIL